VAQQEVFRFFSFVVLGRSGIGINHRAVMEGMDALAEGDRRGSVHYSAWDGHAINWDGWVDSSRAVC
jgi:hypothetical protein